MFFAGGNLRRSMYYIAPGGALAFAQMGSGATWRVSVHPRPASDDHLPLRLETVVPQFAWSSSTSTTFFKVSRHARDGIVQLQALLSRLARLLPAASVGRPRRAQVTSLVACAESEEDKALLCARAEACLGKYSLGVRRVDVDCLGGDPFNRMPSCKHVHSLWKNIVDHQSFQRHRYNHLIALEAHPERPTRVMDWIKSWERMTGGMLPPPTGKETLGVIAHQHLLYGLKCFRNAGIFWEGSTDLMQPPAGLRGDSVREHLEQGVYTLVLSHAAIDEDPQGVEAIVKSYNLDQATCMAESEIDVLSKMVKSVRSKHRTLDRGELLEDYIVKATVDESGGRWNEKSAMYLYNFALTVDEHHMGLLKNFHFHYVNPGIVSMRPTMFDLLSKKIPHGATHLRTYVQVLYCT